MARQRVVIAPAASDAAGARQVVDRARRRGFRAFLVDEGADLSFSDEDEVLHRRGNRIQGPGVRSPGATVASVADEAGLERALRSVPDGGVLVIEWTGDRVIPLENAVAARGRSFELWTYARRASEVPAALGALEHGADRVLVVLGSPEEVDELERTIEGPLPAGLDWRAAPVIAVASAGVGDRVLVDTTSMLTAEEGLLVGSAAAFLFHVASEAVGSHFSRPRPFRVNAGAAHLYVLLADGSTRYLAELEPGDVVLAVEPRGRARTVRVGRIKIERRPLVQVTADVDGTRRTVFLQEAETVRLSTDTGRVPTTELRAGVTAVGVRLPPARHLGRAVEESIEER